MNILTSFLLFIARLSIAAIFVAAGFGKLMAYDETAQYMVSKGFTMIPLFLFGAAFIEILSGIALIIGYKTRIAAFILLVFLIPTTLIFHNFWVMDGTGKAIEQIMFLKNLAIFGGLIYIICFGGGKLSCNGSKCKQNAESAQKELEKPV